MPESAGVTDGGKSTRFKPGQSGNPAGRPRSLAKVVRLRQRIEKDLPEVIDALVRAAKSGDTQAARTLLERVLPAVKPVELPAAIELAAEASPTDQARALVLAAAAGEVAPGQAAALMTVLASLARLIESDELSKRIGALESTLKGKP